MNEVFPLKRVVLLCILAIGCISQVRAQSELNQIGGTVLDSHDQIPLPGVTVKVKGSNAGATTDQHGKYKIEAKPTDVLVFSFVGYKSLERVVANQALIDVSLEGDEAILEEVVVVGYGTQKKASLTGAVSTINAEKLDGRPIATVANGLQGVSPGLIITRSTGQPGNEDIEISIRGATSANGNVPPLVVLDGVSAPSSVLTTLNPNDIESISVLKDAAAATIYGAQAAGGVILVTTKKGKGGQPKIDFSTQIGASRLLNLGERMSLMDEALFNNIAFKNAGSNEPYNDFDLENIRKNVPYVVDPANSSQYKYYNQESPNDILIKKHSLTQIYNLSVRGGAKKINYFLSGGVYDQAGALKVGPNDVKRYNGRMNLGVELNKYVSVESRLSYTRQLVTNPANKLSGDYSVFYEIARFRMRNPFFTPEGRYNNANKTYGYLKEAGYNNRYWNDFDGVFTLKLANLIKGMSLRAVYGIQYRRDDSKNFLRTVPFWGKDGVEGYYNQVNGYNLGQATRKQDNMQYILNYDRQLFSNSEISLTAGYQFESYRYESLAAGSKNLVNNDLPLLNFGDDLTRSNSQDINTYAYQSTFGRLNYTLKKRYIAEVSYRIDESSKLAPGHRIKDFISFSGAWNVHEEPWFKTALPFFSEFKTRASWGQLGGSLGGSAIGNYDFSQLLSRGAGLVLNNQRTPYFYQGYIPSSSLSWETITTSNYGIDLGLLNHKLRFSGDYYIKYNRNMLTPQQLPATLGIGTPKKNNGVLRSWGWETELTYRDKFGAAFNFNIGLNISDNKNKLLEYSNNQVVREGFNTLIEGQSLKSLYGYKTAGYFTSADEVKAWAFQNTKTGVGDVKYVDLNNDSLITVGDGLISNPGDLVYLGTESPRWLFGVTLGFEFKGFDFTAFVQGVGKRHMMPSVFTLGPLMQSWRAPMQFHSDYWTPENPDAVFPRPYYQGFHNYRASDKWVLNAAYARLKNIQFGYSLPNVLLKRLKINNARIFVSAQDIATISKLGVLSDVFDPESREGVVNDYPYSSTTSVGINVGF